VKKILALLIIIAGGILASFIIFSPQDDRQTGIFTETGSDEGTRFGFGGLKQPASGAARDNSRDNLTESFTQEYLEEFIKSNPDGPQLINDIPQIAVPTEETFQALLGNYFRSTFQWEEVTEKDIKVSAEADSFVYLESMREIIDEKTQSIEEEIIALSDFLENGRDGSLRRVTEKLHSQLREILAIAAPADYQETHLQVANFFQKQIAIYSAVLGAEEDPVKAVLAINEFPETGQEFESLRATIE
jgi:hypothetical protein